MCVQYQYLVLQYNGTAQFSDSARRSFIYTYGSLVSTSTAVVQYTHDSQWVQTGDFAEALYLLYCSSTL
jgi:hypothetical protein